MSDVQEALEKLDFEAKVPFTSVEAGIDDSVLETVRQIEDATRAGDLTLVESAMSDLSAVPGAENYTKAPGKALYLAIEHQHLEIITSLLSRNVQLGEGHLKSAVHTRNETTLKILLAHGWDINARLGPAYPPPMA